MKKVYLDIKYSKNKRTKGYILDISKDGMGIASCIKIRRNTIIEIIAESDVLLPLKGRVVSTAARNRKAYNYRLGVKFISLDKRKKENLNKFVLKGEKRELRRLTLSNLWKQD